jgi:hypothetical protein
VKLILAFLYGHMLPTVLLLVAIVTLTVGRWYVIGPIAAKHDVGLKVDEATREYRVGERFLETRKVAYDADSLRRWAKQNPDAAYGYAFPVLFPLDLLFMIIVGGACAAASVMSASYLGVSTGWLWPFLLLPVIYVDLAEDTLLALMLTHPDTITDRMLAIVKPLTMIKIGAFVASLGLTLVVLIPAVTIALWRVARD